MQSKTPKILIVCSYRPQLQDIAPFIKEQVEALRDARVKVDIFSIRKKGFWGYFQEYFSLRKKISMIHPDVIHAHFGLSALLANLQRIVPVVSTYHGSDINNPKLRILSKIAVCLSAYNVFVSQKNVDLINPQKNYILLPCGVNLKQFTKPAEDVSVDGRILFAGAFDNIVKNAFLAKSAVALLQNVELIELKNFTRQEIVRQFALAKVFLMTSKMEGSPQVIKEAMATGCPIVSVDVGDVVERISKIDGCYIAERNAQDIAEKLRLALNFKGRTNAREFIVESGLDNAIIAQKLLVIYRQISK